MSAFSVHIIGAHNSGRTSLINAIKSVLVHSSQNHLSIDLIESPASILFESDISSSALNSVSPSPSSNAFVVVIDMNDACSSEETLNAINVAFSSNLLSESPLLLVGTKSDLPQRISDLHIEHILTNNQSLQYLQTSSLANAGVSELVTVILQQLCISEQNCLSSRHSRSTTPQKKQKSDNHPVWQQMIHDSAIKNEENPLQLSSIFMSSDRHSVSASSDVIGFLNEYQNLKATQEEKPIEQYQQLSTEAINNQVAHEIKRDPSNYTRNDSNQCSTSSLSMFEKRFTESNQESQTDYDGLQSSRFNESSVQQQQTHSHFNDHSIRIPAASTQISQQQQYRFDDSVYSEDSSASSNILASQDLNCLKAGDKNNKSFSSCNLLAETLQPRQFQKTIDTYFNNATADNSCYGNIGNTTPSSSMQLNRSCSASESKLSFKQQLSEVNSFQRKKNVDFVMSFCVELKGNQYFIDVMHNDDAYSLVNKFASVAGIHPNITQIKALANRFQQHIVAYSENLHAEIKKNNSISSPSLSVLSTSHSNQSYHREFLSEISVQKIDSNNKENNNFFAEQYDLASSATAAAAVGSTIAALVSTTPSVKKAKSHLLTSPSTPIMQQIYKPKTQQQQQPIPRTNEEKILEFTQSQPPLPHWLTSYRILSNETIIVQLSIGPNAFSVRVDKRDQVSAVLARCAAVHKMPQHALKDLTCFLEKAKGIFKSK